MDNLIIDVSNPDNWAPIWSGSYEQRPVPGELTRFYPIGTINIPIIVSTPILLVNCTSQNSPLNWRFAGFLRQVIPTPLVIGSASTTNYEQRRLFLNRLTLIRFEQLARDYQLLIDVPYWIIDASFSLFEYTGVIETSVDRRLASIETKLDNAFNL